MAKADLQGSESRFTWPPELDRLWDALAKRGMHYDRESMEHDEPDLAERHRASLALALGEGGWVPRSEAEALAEALEEVKSDPYRASLDLQPMYMQRCRDALEAYRSRHPKETP